ncbi:MAG: DUF2764 family protein [Fibrobacterota bacterium]
MSSSYYYLVAGLPDIIRGGGKKKVPYGDLRELIASQVSEEDKRAVAWVSHRYDNDNLLALLREKSFFDPRGFYSREVLEFRLENPDTLPQYMQDFLAARKEDRQIFPHLEEDEQLAALYFSQLKTQKNTFLRRWAEIELNLRNFTAGLNARELELPLEKSVLPVNETSERILASSSSDFGLSGQFSWAEEILSKLNQPIALEHALDSTVWNELEELTEGHWFSIEVVLSFLIRLNTIQRWQNIDPETARKKLDSILKNIKSAVQL